MRSVVVTGVSTGIGWGTAQVLIRRGFHVFGSVRKKTDADTLRTAFGQRFTPLLLDVTDEGSVSRAAETVRAQLGDRTLAGLVNNAGIAIGGPLLLQPLEEFRRHLEVDLIGPLTLIRTFAPFLGTDRHRHGAPGRIVNISSTSGRIGYPFLGAYTAAKHGLEGMSESLRRELSLYSIAVIVVAPGSVATPIWDKVEQADISVYAQTEFYEPFRRLLDYTLKEGRRGCTPGQIGDVVWKALTARRPRIRYAVVPRRELPELVLPRRLLDTVIARMQRGAGA